LHATVVDTLPMFILPGITQDGQPIQPGGTLSWTPVVTVPGGAWQQTFAVSAEPDYVGPLTNTVDVNTQEGATGKYTATPRTYIEKLHFLPLSTLRADMTLCAPRLITERETGPGPRQVALDTAGRRAFIAHADGITVIDLDSFATITTISSPAMAHGIDYDPDHDRIWVTRNKADRVVVLDGATFTQLADLPTGDEPHSVAYNSANGRVYVTNYHGWTVSVYNAENLTYVTELTDFAEPAHLVVNSATNKIYVANHRPGTHVTVIDGATHSTKRIPTNLIDAYGIALDANRNLIYVTAIAHGRISIIDGSTDVELGFLNIQRDNGKRVPLRVITVNPDMGPEGHLLVVTSSEDGGKDQLLLIPNGWPSLGRPVPLDLAPYPLEGIALDPDTDRVWVTSVGSGLVSVVRDGEAVCPFQLTAYEATEAEFDIRGEYDIRVEINP
jgi:DNA-binding beta-propeller fold protein YncE